ncbi:unnamed protein product [Owenia fusiformis]|uniref:Uncharacterized protein n=1 Tax=Owenia fusiformis TaxID=6347 RepID=A0A8J1Y9Q2_OWEFU|nr:unnamed protein product [Owenia fusiformis]
MDIHGTELVYKKVINPGLDNINHANKLGIRLKSTNALRSPMPIHANRSNQLRDKLSPRKILPQNADSASQSYVTNDYIRDVIVPISPVPNTDDGNVHRSITPLSFASSSRMKKVPLPLVSGKVPTPNSARNLKTMSLCSERQYLNSVPSERMSSQHYDEDDAENWNKSDQALRFSGEQKLKNRSLTLKRVSEIKPHRVDRMYYMSGNQLPIKSRYDIDEQELLRLRSMTSRGSRSYRPHLKGRIGWESVEAASKQNSHNDQGNENATMGTHPSFATLTTKQDKEQVESVFMTEGAAGETPRDHLGSQEPDDQSPRLLPSNQDDLKLEILSTNENDNPDVDSVAVEFNTTREQAENDTQRKPPENETVEEEPLEEETDRWDPNADVKEAILLQRDIAQSVKTVAAPAPTPAPDADAHQAVFLINKDSQKLTKKDAMKLDFTRHDGNNDDETNAAGDSDDKLKGQGKQASSHPNKGGNKGGGPNDEDGDGTHKLAGLMDMLQQGNATINQNMYKGDISAAELAKMKEDSKLGDLFRKKTSHLAPKVDPKQDLKNSLKEMEGYSFVSDLQREAFLAKFRELDMDGSGSITSEELSTKLFANSTKEDLDYFMKTFDLNKDQMIDEEEFVTLLGLNDKLNGHMTTSKDEPLELNLPRLSYHITVYKEMFQLADQEMHGRLSIKDVMLIMTSGLGQAVGTDKELVDIIHNTIDKDQSGYIDFVEYLSFIPFFIKIHQHMMAQPVLIEHIENARKLVRQALRRKPNKDAGIGMPQKKATADIWN